MRAQAMESLLKLFEKAVEEKNEEALKNLAAKSKILRDRSDKSASVLRELINF